MTAISTPPESPLSFPQNPPSLRLRKLLATGVIALALGACSTGASTSNEAVEIADAQPTPTATTLATSVPVADDTTEAAETEAPDSSVAPPPASDTDPDTPPPTSEDEQSDEAAVVSFDASMLCPVAAGASSVDALSTLAATAQQAGNDSLAERLAGVAGALSQDATDANALVAVPGLLAEMAADEQLPDCSSVLGGSLGSVVSVASGEATTEVAAATVESVLQSAYDVPAEDATCVAEQLDISVDDAPDEIALLVALSTCTNR